MTDIITEKVHDPIHRCAMSFRREGGDLWVETWFESGAHLPEHFHPSLEEHWEVLEGEARLKLDGVWHTLTPADGPVVVRRDARHELRNDSGAPAHAHTYVTPAGRLDEFLTETARGAREGLYNARNLPTSLKGAGWISRLALEFREETVMCSPPPALQRVLLALGRRL
ncbi:MAG: cupin domain-containing protein [Solirubrobacteraceae bacterium]